MKQLYVAELISQAVDGTALTASTTPTSILHVTGKKTIQPNDLKVGDRLTIDAHGRVSNIITTPGTLTLEVRLGPASAIAVASSGAMALNIVAKTNVPWQLHWELELRAVGSGTSANFMHQGHWISESVIGAALPSAGGAGVHLLPNAAPGVGTGFDSTGLNLLDLFATWSLNNANSITLHGYRVFLEN